MVKAQQKEAKRDIYRLDPLISAFMSSKNSTDLFASACKLAVEMIHAQGVSVLLRSNGHVTLVSAYPYDTNQQEEMPSWIAALAKSYGQMFAENYQIVPLNNDSSGVFVPLFSTDQGLLCLAAYVHGTRSVRLQNVGDTLQLIRAMLFMANRHNEASPQGTQQENTKSSSATEPQFLQEVLHILSAFQVSTQCSQACITLCAEVARRFSARRVGLGLVRSRSVHVIALDQMDSFKRGTRTVRQLESVMEEALDQERIVFYSALEAEQSAMDVGVITKASKELAHTMQVTRVISIPLYTQQEGEKIEFVMVCLFDGHEMPLEKTFQSLNLVAKLAAPRLKDLTLAEEIFFKKIWRYFRIKSADIFGEKRTILKLSTAIVGIFLLTTLILKDDLEISAPLVVEGVHSYTHTAPLDGFLSEVLVRPGDIVKKNDVLGRLDATQILLEVTALEAEGHIHKSQASQFLQEGKSDEANIASLEAERVDAKLAWARERLLMTELRSSVDGFLVSQDMYAHLGQPVRRGQELFEVTDTEMLRIVAHISETDISDINTARKEKILSGEFILTAYPSLYIPFEVERIHPYAITKDQQNGFELRGELTNPPQNITLRPGMEGFAKIKAGKKTILELWTRKVINKIRIFIWTWF